jgi:transketolase
MVGMLLHTLTAHDSDAIERALLAAKAVTDKPSLICCKTTIGMGAPNKQGSHDCHGAPLGKDEIAAAREYIGWNHPPFVIPRRRLCRLERQATRRNFRRKLEQPLQGLPSCLPGRSRRVRAPRHEARTAG